MYKVLLFKFRGHLCKGLQQVPGYYSTEKTFAVLLLRRRYQTKTYVTDVAMMREIMFFLL